MKKRQGRYTACICNFAGTGIGVSGVECMHWKCEHSGDRNSEDFVWKWSR